MHVVPTDNQLLKHHIIPRGKVHKNLSVTQLIEKALTNKEVMTSNTGALVVYTGKYTGRSPKDKFIVDTPSTHETVDWGSINQPMSKKAFDRLHKKMGNYLSEKEEVFVFDGYVGAHSNHSYSVRVISQYAYQSLFMHHLLRRLESSPMTNTPEITVICAPGFFANPTEDNTNSEAFIVADFETKTVLIGGTKYAGEMKKAVFTVMNYLLPEEGAFPMHAAANVGESGESALFFGLSGTGKTTLSADPQRLLLGDDEHGWTDDGIFNFEGGCYAKCINLQKESEPLIWNAITHGALVENAVLNNIGEFDFTDSRYTENIRVAYPIEYIRNAHPTGIAGHPSVILFLTADAFGVLPPVAKLSEDAAVYHFLSGYTSKLAGTERGITTPVATFSAYFGAPFMPRKPQEYAALLKKYITKHKSQVYLVNTGWMGGPYGVGKRISIADTRAIVTAILTGKLEKATYYHDTVFNLDVPTSVPGVDKKRMYPRDLWKDHEAFDTQAQQLSQLFRKNFTKFATIPKHISAAGPNGIQ